MGWLRDRLAAIHPLPYLIAEAGVNHGGDVREAETMIRRAATAGVHAIKFQVYKADDLVSAVAPAPTYFADAGTPAPNQHAFFSRYDGLNRGDYEQLAALARQCGIDFLVTPFAVRDVAWLNELVPAWKIASADITNLLLVQEVAATGKSVICSTGAATMSEIKNMCAEVAVSGADLALLHCILRYPTPWNAAALSTISELARCFPDCIIGYSDHTVWDDGTLLRTAWLLGAQIIEKHYTLDRSQPGNDHYHALEPYDFAYFLATCRNIAPVLTSVLNDRSAEANAREAARRSWHAAHDLMPGQHLTMGDVLALRPAVGIPVSVPIDGIVMARAVRQGYPIRAEDVA